MQEGGWQHVEYFQFFVEKPTGRDKRQSLVTSLPPTCLDREHQVILILFNSYHAITRNCVLAGACTLALLMCVCGFSISNAPRRMDCVGVT